MPVRTAQLVHARGFLATVVNVLWTCPAGHTAIVKDVRITNPGSAPASVNLLVRRAGVNVSVTRSIVPATTTTPLAGAHVVLEPADELVFVTDVADIMVLVSGALLDGVAPGG